MIQNYNIYLDDYWQQNSEDCQYLAVKNCMAERTGFQILPGRDIQI